ncbi:YhcN/YlaJ family sporulation lipoprotein [Anaerosolibacter carboniphilus]|uniref:YhcN/YlaJ family sporulation lipoprotein n=1 Tax=Anaerosolibacter carboniphilus TaxID=1417629 RepID=A0A841KSL8_9FIRM|nr:YhcN/YlaJ family sporulation lipoprotein [Anaerosolibacter carboniphilus]MBB6216576.1 YhcN/YlaJ family sporulation lipoprotein [Anaerosolibacter carboniphilus]
MKYLKHSKLFSTILTVLLVFSVLIIGCTPARRPIVENNNQPNTTMRTPITTPAPRTTETPNRVDNRANTTERDERIATELEKINGVQNAYVLTNDSTAYVGLGLDPNIESARTITIKDDAIAKVKSVDTSVRTVYVSSDIDVVGRFRGYIQDIRGGRPISGFINEIEEMFRRTVPRT